MTAVTISSSPTGIIRTWDTPPGSAAPMGEILFEDLTFAIPSKLAADEHRIFFTFTLPRNFVYRIVEQAVQFIAPGTSPLSDIERFMTGQYTENQVSKRLWMFTPTVAFYSVNALRAFKSSFDSVTNDFALMYEVTPGAFLERNLIDASQGVSIVSWTLMDTTATTTLALSCSFRCRLLFYSVEQFNRVGINLLRGLV